MATGPNSAGIDVLGITGPLVDLAFTLTGNYKVTVTLTLGGTQEVDAVTDARTITGAVVLEGVPAIPGEGEDKEGTDANLSDQSLFINPSDLLVAAQAAGLQSVPPINDNDTLVLRGVRWNIIAVLSPPNSPVLQIQIRK